MKNSSEIQNIYNENIAQMFRAYEVCRRKNALKYRLWYVFAVVINLVACSLFPIIVSLCIQDGLIIGLLTAFVFACFILGLYIYRMTRNFEKNFLFTLKTNCLPEILKFFGEY